MNVIGRPKRRGILGHHRHRHRRFFFVEQAATFAIGGTESHKHVQAFRPLVGCDVIGSVFHPGQFVL